MMDELNDKYLKNLLKDSKVEMPFSDFEEKMMLRVKNEVQGKRIISKNMGLSWFFFFMGSVFGLGVSVTIPMLQLEWAGIDLQNLKYPLMLVVLFIIIWQLDEMLRLTLRQRKQKRLQ